MIIIERKLKYFIPYRTIYWPTHEMLKELAERLSLSHYARAEAADAELGGPCVISRHLGLTLLIDLRQNPDAIYRDMIPNARIRIHKAEKLGGRVTLKRYAESSDREAILGQFLSLYNELSGRTTATPRLSMAVINSYLPHADLMMAYLDGNPISGHLNLVDKTTRISRLLHSANKRFQDQGTARLAGIINVYLHWYELQKYREEGFVSYDFGTIGQAQDSVGVNRFKMQFGGRIVREYYYIFGGAHILWRAAFNLMMLTRRGKRRVELEAAAERWKRMSLEQIRESIENSINEYQRSRRTRQA